MSNRAIVLACAALIVLVHAPAVQAQGADPCRFLCAPSFNVEPTITIEPKLNFELDTAVSIFRWLPDQHWLRGVELEGSLDYVATGLPRAGDVVGGERYLDKAGPWSFSLVLVIPIISGR